MRRANEGETASERAYIRISHLTRLRDAQMLLGGVCQSVDPLNIPAEEWQQVNALLDGFIARLENRKDGE